MNESADLKLADLEVLRTARARIDAGWTKGTNHFVPDLISRLGPSYNTQDATSPTAGPQPVEFFCLRGACLHTADWGVWERLAERLWHQLPSTTQAKLTVQAPCTLTTRMVDFNDLATSKFEVLQVVDRTILALEAEIASSAVSSRPPSA